jgi:serine/threonine protein kinase
MRQAVAGLLQMHSLGILHRDVRAANVLVASNDPFTVVLADFGLSHRLSKAPVVMGAGGAADLDGRQSLSTWSPSEASTFLHGDEAVFPVEWNAPEVCRTTEWGTRASIPSDVYMAGGLLFELLTAGERPFFWLIVNPSLLSVRRATGCDVGVPVPGAPGVAVPGLYGKHVLQVAGDDGESIPWRVRRGTMASQVARLEVVKKLMEDCLAEDPAARPDTHSLQEKLQNFYMEELEDMRMTDLSISTAEVEDATHYSTFHENTEDGREMGGTGARVVTGGSAGPVAVPEVEEAVPHSHHSPVVSPPSAPLSEPVPIPSTGMWKRAWGSLNAS